MTHRHRPRTQIIYDHKLTLQQTVQKWLKKCKKRQNSVQFESYTFVRINSPILLVSSSSISAKLPRRTKWYLRPHSVVDVELNRIAWKFKPRKIMTRYESCVGARIILRLKRPKLGLPTQSWDDCSFRAIFVHTIYKYLAPSIRFLVRGRRRKAKLYARGRRRA